MTGLSTLGLLVSCIAVCAKDGFPATPHNRAIKPHACADPDSQRRSWQQVEENTQKVY
jgi:hypothetical protein